MSCTHDDDYEYLRERIQRLEEYIGYYTITKYRISSGALTESVIVQVKTGINNTSLLSVDANSTPLQTYLAQLIGLPWHQVKEKVEQSIKLAPVTIERVS